MSTRVAIWEFDIPSAASRAIFARTTVR